MKFVEKFSGSYEMVWLNMKEAAGTYPLLIDSAVEVRCSIFGDATRPNYTVFFWLGHTGAKAYALLALSSNNGNKEAEAILLEGDHWGTRSIIREANYLAGVVFPEAGLRDRRSIVIEMCKRVHDLLQRLDSKQTDEIPNEEVKLTMSINTYDALLDVEYIEEVMCFWEELGKGLELA